MNKLLSWSSGKKTYIVALLTVLWAVVGLGMGWLDWEAAVPLISGSLLASGLRHGVASSSGKKRR